MSVVPCFNRRNVGALVAVTLVLVVGYVLVPGPISAYGAWLAVFTIRMAWFVLAGIEWLRNADF
jgi:hypothetical protein